MKKYVFAVLVLWMMVFGTTFLLIHERSVFTFLAPVFLFGMIGNIRLIGHIYSELNG